MKEMKSRMSWEELLLALKTEYTLSIRDVCCLFKASRLWVSTYVKPHIKTIYVNNNRRGDYQIGTNWVQIAAMELERPIVDSVWFHTEDLFNFIKNNIVSVTKQTKFVPVTMLMDNEEKTRYLEKISKIDVKLKKEKNYSRRADLIHERNLCFYNFLGDEEQDLCKKQQSVTSRTKIEPVSYSLQIDDIDNLKKICDEWLAPHDIKNYGDTDEEVYRRFFRYGYVRIELRFPDVEGENYGKKIYYLPDPHYIREDDKVKGIPRLILGEMDWQNYVIKKYNKVKDLEKKGSY